MRNLYLRLLARREKGSTMIELLTVIVIIAILLAIAAPSIIGDLKRSQDTGTKNNLSLAYQVLKKSEVSSTAADCSPQTPPCFLPTSSEAKALQSALPEVNVQAGLPLQGQAKVDEVGVETDGSGEAVLCSKSASGNFFSVRVVLSGSTQGVYYGTGDSCTDGSNPATPGIPYDPNNGPDPNPPGQGSGETTSVDWTGGGTGSGNSTDCHIQGDCAIAPPVNLTAPQISGNPGDVAGNTLSTSNGTWDSHYPVSSFTYQWQRSNDGGLTFFPIAGATSSSYITTSSDMQQYVNVVVTASGVNGGQTTATSPKFLVANPPANNGGSNLPVISDNQGNYPPQDGDTLTATNTEAAVPSTWTGTKPFTHAYQWQRCTSGSCVNISGQTGLTYTITGSDIGSSFAFVETESNIAGTASATSKKTAVANGAPPGNTDAGSGTSGSCPGTANCDSASGSGGSVHTPVNTSAPSTSGQAVVGSVLNGDPGSWSGPATGYQDQWLRCDTSGNNCAAISGATGPVYTLTSSDSGSTVRFQVTASNSQGSTTAKSSPTTVVVNGAATRAPINTVPPSISGTATVGNTLVVNPGTWSNGPTTYSYQWERCDSSGNNCIDIVGATDPAYTLQASDQGETIKVKVTAANNAGSNSSTSSATVAVAAQDPSKNYPQNTALPSIRGIDSQGQTLNGDVGAWTYFPSSYTYQWERCDTSGASCSSIVGAASLSYVLISDDVGHTLRLVVVATNGDGNGYAVSSPTSVVTGAGNQTVTPPSNTSAPTVSGTDTQGYVLTGTLGTWTGTNPTLTPQWQRCDTSGNNCVDIPGANGTTYLLGATDAGHTIVFEVIGQNAGGATVAHSSHTSTIASGTSGTCDNCGSTNNPTISDPTHNPPHVGDTFTSTQGAWAGTPPFSYSYQWQYCNSSGTSCSNIPGATSSAYTPTTTYINYTLSSCVTASNAYGGGVACSPASGVIVDFPKNAGGGSAPTISGGPPGIGTVMTANVGTWTGTAPITYTYQWERCDSAGNNCSAISGATASTYTTTTSDAGDTLRVVVGASNAYGTGTPMTTAQTSQVGSAPVNTVNAPSLSGHTGINWSGTVNPNYLATNYSVYVSTSPSGTGGTDIYNGSVPAGGSPVGVSGTWPDGSGAQGTTYYVQIVSSNVVGTGYSGWSSGVTTDSQVRCWNGSYYWGGSGCPAGTMSINGSAHGAWTDGSDTEWTIEGVWGISTNDSQYGCDTTGPWGQINVSPSWVAGGFSATDYSTYSGTMHCYGDNNGASDSQGWSASHP